MRGGGGAGCRNPVCDTHAILSTNVAAVSIGTVRVLGRSVMTASYS
eukprot:COSAG01_NODE_61446_length_289_cov_1.105263_1_plen_45_part_10